MPYSLSLSLSFSFFPSPSIAFTSCPYIRSCYAFIQLGAELQFECHKEIRHGINEYKARVYNESFDVEGCAG